MYIFLFRGIFDYTHFYRQLHESNGIELRNQCSGMRSKKEDPEQSKTSRLKFTQ